MSETDRDLLARCLNGDASAWEKFVEKYTSVIYSSILTVLKSCAQPPNDLDSQDIYHHILISLLEDDYKKLKQFEGRNKAKLSTWLGVVATRMTLNCVMKKSSLVTIDEQKKPMHLLPGESGNYQAHLERKERYDRVEELIRTKLKPREKLFLRLFFEKELPISEIAAIMDLSANNVYVLKNRILEKIKKLYCKKNSFFVSLLNKR